MSHALKPSGLLYTFLLCFSVSPSDAEIVYKAIGEDVVLSLPLVESSIRSVEWKHNGDIAAEIYRNESHCLLQFKGRCEVNMNTGALTIKGLRLNDSGIYTPEINGKNSNKIHLSVISRIGKPTVVKSCSTKLTNYRLTCEGNTTEAEPITYKWFYNDMEGPSGKVWTIIKDRLETSFRCMMMNPVSNETSAHFKNPFIIHVEPGLVYGAKGDDMILGPPPMNDTIQSIVWKHKANIAADWYEAGNEFMCHGQFIGRCEVNTDTGALTIKGMMLKDIGIYTPEINCKDYNKIQLSVISRVTKPSVGKSCNTKNTLCRLTCEGNTADAEPITYKWLYDNKEDGPSVQKILLTEYLKEDHFRCIMMNPVSNGTSESITNPLIKQEQDWLISILVPVVVVVVLVVVILFAVFIYKHIREKRRRPNNRRDDKKENGTKYELKPLNNSKGAKGTCDKTQHLSNGADASGVRRTSLVSDPPVIQNGHSGAETETVTPETSNQSPAEAAVSDTDQETDLPSVEVPDPLNSGCLHTNKDSEKSALMPDKKPETNCEPSADEQRADD